MDVWPQIDSEPFDEAQGRQIKSKLFGFARFIPGKRTVNRNLGEIMASAGIPLGNVDLTNEIVHYLVSYGIPLGNQKILEFGLANLEDAPLSRDTRYIVSVNQY